MPANLENSEEAKRLEGVHFHFSPRENESESHSVVSDSLPPHGLYSPWNSPGQNTGVGSLSLLQGIYPTKGSRPGLPHCRQIIYQLSQTRILEWDAISISRGIFPTQELNPCLLLGRWITSHWATREAKGPRTNNLEEVEQSWKSYTRIVQIYFKTIVIKGVCVCGIGTKVEN